jgi:tRNA pseudouridine38-40 synthase
VSGAPDDTRPRVLRLDLQFDGTDFEGWQRQAGGRTVQGEVERALERVLGAPHALVGCGRTDAGVHARQHVSSFRTQACMPARELGRALDAVLPPDVGVLALREAAPGFHARRNAAWKWYRYRLLLSRAKRPLRRRRVWRRARAPDLEALCAAAAPLRGRHDFRSFANSGSRPGTTVRTLHTLAWSARRDELRLDVVGDGFLYKMVRTIVGTLLEAGASEDPQARVREVLRARDRAAAGRAVPPTGLCLMAVAVRGEPAPATVPASLRPGVHSLPAPDPSGRHGALSQEPRTMGGEPEPGGRT